MNYISFNGKIIDDAKPVLLATNRSYRYGDGLFETIKVLNGKILLADKHFERLFAGLALLKFEISLLFNRTRLEEEILHLCQKNNCDKLARIRLSVSRGNGGLYDEDKKLQYLIECWPLSESENQLNENGLVIDVYPDARKSCDKFSNLKSANFQPYSMAALFAKEKKLNDCLVLNTKGNISDSTIANLFIIKGERIITPSLEEGCIDGVMRKYILISLRNAGRYVEETSVSIEAILNADEVFLTNAIKGVRWVRQFRDSLYTNKNSIEIYKEFVQTIDA
jgi:branched-chain amino acid aminotransferase